MRMPQKLLVLDGKKDRPNIRPIFINTTAVFIHIGLMFGLS